jgi:GNAT superfamily N-acetyltransferase
VIMAKTEIRAARREDVRAIETIFRSYEPEHDWEYARKYYEDFFGSPEHHREDAVLVAVSEGRVVGVIGMNPDRYEADDIYWLGWFYVHKDERGRKHGVKLLKAVIKEVRRRGGRKLYTDTSTYAFYDGAHRVYKDRGFKVEGRLRDFYEEGEDQVIYGLELA